MKSFIKLWRAAQQPAWAHTSSRVTPQILACLLLAGISVACSAGVLAVQAKPLINDITGLNPVYVEAEKRPRSINEVVSFIRASTGPISIGGGRYSQGGQINYPDSLHLDMRALNRVVDLDLEKREVTLQAGVTWRQLQQLIDQHGLAVQIMQTYANFTVGGSISVNVHGRYIGEGPLVHSVKTIKLVLADGSQVRASRELNPEVFWAAIGGYGGLGVIVEATLSLTDNIKVERRNNKMAVTDYADFFTGEIRNNPKVVFHNADLYPPNFTNLRQISWLRTDKPLTDERPLIAEHQTYVWTPRVTELVANSTVGKWLREFVIDPLIYLPGAVVWRNREASYDVAELEPADRRLQTYALREYFVPVSRFDEFVPKLREIFARHQANIINVSIRHAHSDPGTLMAWAKGESFAFVVYYRQGTDQVAKDGVRAWSRDMIDAALSVGGSYYLPYQVQATKQQFAAAYPRHREFFKLKQRLDPDYRFRNALWTAYYSPDRQKTNPGESATASTLNKTINER